MVVKMLEYNELTQYVIEENGELVVKDIKQTDTLIVPEQTESIFTEFVKPLSTDERLSLVEKAVDELALGGM